MDLYELVETRNYLMKFLNDNVDFLGYEQCFNRVPEKIREEKEVFQLILPLIESLKISNDKIKDYVIKKIELLNNEIEDKIKHCYYPDYEFTNNDEVQKYTSIVPFSVETKRKLLTPEDVFDDIRTIIQSKSEWKYPSLEIGCGNNDVSRCLITSEPFYVTDIHRENLASLKNTFNEVYKRKVRCYVNMNKDYNNFNFLPQEQFKFILSWNVLNYYPKNDLREFLSSCWNLLRPGGSMIFSYNDCDYKECVKKFKTGVGSWMNESLIKEVTKDVGLVIKNIHHSYETIHWVECNKPGDLSSTKVSSPIGRIIT